MQISVNVFGQEELQKELKEEVRQIDERAHLALFPLGFEIGKTLDRHLRSDWYEEYSPSMYQRRTDDPSLGNGLMSPAYKDYDITGKRLTFTYEPSGEHQIEAFHDRDGDELIDSIQFGKDISAPPRPFWENTLDELENGGILNGFIEQMKPYKVIPDKDVIDLSESRISTQTESGVDNLPY